MEKPWGRFSGIWVITDPGSDRHRNFLRFARRLGIENLMTKKALRPSSGNSGFCAGELGCWMSHSSISVSHQLSNDPILVFEDDCWHMPGKSPEYEAEEIGRIMDSHPSCDVLRFGYGVFPGDQVKPVARPFFESSPVHCTHACVYFPSAISRMANAWSKGVPDAVLDVWLGRHLRVIQSERLCFRQYGFSSTIGKYEVDIEFLVESTGKMISGIKWGDHEDS